MKQIVIPLCVGCLILLSGCQISSLDWTPLDLSFLGYPVFSNETPVYGFNFGAVPKSQKSVGIQVGFLSSHTNHFSGLIAAPYYSKCIGDTYGVNCSLLSSSYEYTPYLSELEALEECRTDASRNRAFNINMLLMASVFQGCSFSIRNFCWLNQGVLIAMYPAAFYQDGLLLGVMNTGEYGNGPMIGLYNALEYGRTPGAKDPNISEPTYHSFSQVGVINILKKKEDDLSTGFQLGIINKSNAGIQFGLINIKPNSKLLTVMPLFNW